MTDEEAQELCDSLDDFLSELSVAQDGDIAGVIDNWDNTFNDIRSGLPQLAYIHRLARLVDNQRAYMTADEFVRFIIKGASEDQFIF